MLILNGQEEENLVVKIDCLHIYKHYWKIIINFVYQFFYMERKEAKR